MRYALISLGEISIACLCCLRSAVNTRPDSQLSYDSEESPQFASTTEIPGYGTHVPCAFLPSRPTCPPEAGNPNSMMMNSKFKILPFGWANLLVYL